VSADEVRVRPDGPFDVGRGGVGQVDAAGRDALAVDEEAVLVVIDAPESRDGGPLGVGQFGAQRVARLVSQVVGPPQGNRRGLRRRG